MVQITVTKVFVSTLFFNFHCDTNKQKTQKKTRQSAAAYKFCWEKQELSSAARTNNTVSRRKRVLSQLNQVGTRCSAFLGVSRGRSTDSVKTVEKLLKIVEKQQSQAQSDECSWRSDWLDGALSFSREPLAQMKVMQIRQGETQSHQQRVMKFDF